MCTVLLWVFFLNIFCPALLSGFLSFGIHSHGTDLGFHLKLTEARCPSETGGGGEKGFVLMGGGINARLEQASDMGLTANLRSFLD